MQILKLPATDEPIADDDWNWLGFKVAARHRLMRRFLERPFPFGFEAFALGRDDAEWLAEQIRQAVHWTAVIHRGYSPVRSRVEVKAEVEVWCASVDAEFRRRRLYGRIVTGFRRVFVATVVLTLAAGLTLLAESFGGLRLLRTALQNLDAVTAAWLLMFFAAGVVASLVVGSFLRALSPYSPRLAGLLRALFWSPAALVWLVVGGALVSIEPSGGRFPETVILQVRVPLGCAALGYGLPLVLASILWRDKAVGPRLLVSRFRKWLASLTRRLVRVPPRDEVPDPTATSALPLPPPSAPPAPSSPA